MKIYAISTSGLIWRGAIFETKALATEFLLKIEPTCKRQAKRSKFSGCEVFDNKDGKTFCIISLFVRKIIS